MNQHREELRPYRTFGLTMLQLMGILATLGIVVAVVVHYL